MWSRNHLSRMHFPSCAHSQQTMSMPSLGEVKTRGTGSTTLKIGSPMEGVQKTGTPSVEVKTTDAYRIALDTIAAYRDKLRTEKQIVGVDSMLIVVGREDTGELGAQVRGSRHAWDMGLISVDALAHLAKLKESTEDAATGTKIRSVLVPKEYTRLDGLIDVLLTAAKDVETRAGRGRRLAAGQPSLAR